MCPLRQDQRIIYCYSRKNKGGIKLHTVLDHNGYLPTVVDMTEANVADINAGRKIQFKKGYIVVFDRGHNDYEWFARLTSNGVFFVIRLKKYADYTVLKRTPVQKKGSMEEVWDIMLPV